ncbi:MAG: hypothetical protein J6Y48_10405 [Clostridia bacterium]|nr:hypothetical protein [Clostridia bacterium]
MSNPLFGLLGGNSMPGPLGNLMQMLTQLKSNPMSMLQRAGYNLPQNLSDPQQIIQHLTQTGQINQAQLNQAQQMAQMFGQMTGK